MTISVNSLYRQIYFICVVFASGYMASLHLRPYPLDFLVKSIPIFTLGYLAFSGIKGRKGKLLALGFFCCGAGDIFLALKHGQFFIHGLLAFLVGHLFFIRVFSMGFSKKINMSRMPAAIGMVLYGMMIGWLMLPELGDMALPVITYLVVILLMGTTAALGENNPGLAVLGAGFFIVSDSMIAINRFWMPVPAASFFIMATYYTGQFLICHGMVRHHLEGKYGQSGPIGFES